MANKIYLPNGCSMSIPSVYPPNWKDGGKELLTLNWRVQYYFYDPAHARKRKLVIVKGMNHLLSLIQRRTITRKILDDEIKHNKRGFNPFYNKFINPVDPVDAELHENLPFIDAFRASIGKIKCSEGYKKQLEWTVSRLETSAKKLSITHVSIYDLKRRQLKQAFEGCDLPNNYYNKARGYVSRLFTELIQYECCETNLVRDIRPRKTIKKDREIMTKKEFLAVMDYLENNYYTFYRYANIFMYSGARTSEMMQLKAKDVSLKNQEFKVTIKKGNEYKEVTKVIFKEVMPFWGELLSQAKPNDYLFSKFLKPGQKSIQPYQITKRWYRLVKKSDKIKDDNGKVLNITADFYAFKHTFLDSLPEDKAMQVAHHTNIKTTSIYRVNKEKRDREALKKIDVKLHL